MNLIKELWQNENLPTKDGLYFVDGRSFSAIIDATLDDVNFLVKRDQFDLEAFLRDNSDCLTTIDITKKVLLNEQEGYLCCGEAAHGSEGFFARLDINEKLVWVVYFEESNPFVDIKVDGDYVKFITNLDTNVSVNIRNI